MLDLIISNKNIHLCLEKYFDINVLKKVREIDDEDGHMKYNYRGKVFAINGSGGEYIVLEDSSIAFKSSEGRIGRIAEDVKQMFELIINCPYWEDYLNKEEYYDIEGLNKYAKEIYRELSNDMGLDGIDLSEKQVFLAKALDLNLYLEVGKEVLARLYKSANRELMFYGEYTEDDGSKYTSSGTVF